MKSKLNKNQIPQLLLKKKSGVVIECEEIVIAVFAPPREHGKAHCHVRSKKAYKLSGRKLEDFPEIKVFLDGSGMVTVTKGFTLKDTDIIGQIIFNHPTDGELSRDKFLLNIWENLHGQS